MTIPRAVLGANGCACSTASDGGEALKIIGATPDILVAVSDIDMPGIDGFSLLEKLNARGRRTPRVVFLAAHRITDYASAAFRLGAIVASQARAATR